MRTAFLGLGLMGDPIAQRLARVMPHLAVWNRDPGKAAGAIAAGARAFPSASQAARGADVLFLCLTDAAAVEDVLFGAHGAASALAPGALVVDLSTIGPDATRRFAARLDEVIGAGWVDAPVTGGVAGALAGSLIVLCGGAAAEVERVRPLFAAFACSVRHLGALGAGQAAKMCNQLIVSINVLAIAEAFAVGERHGLDPALLPDALAGGWADSAPLQLLGPRIAERRADPRVLAIGTLAKDVRAALATGAGAAAETPLARAASAMYDRLEAAGAATQDVALLGALLADATGLDVDRGAERCATIS